MLEVITLKFYLKHKETETLFLKVTFLQNRKIHQCLEEKCAKHILHVFQEKSIGNIEIHIGNCKVMPILLQCFAIISDSES